MRGRGGRMEDYKHFLKNTPAYANNTTCMCLAKTWWAKEAKKKKVLFPSSLPTPELNFRRYSSR